MKKAIRYIDIHGHVNFPEYDADREEVIKRASEAGVGMITVGTDIESSKKAIELAETHENIWAIVGIHPTEIVESKDRELIKLGRRASAGDDAPATTQDERRLFRHERSDMRKSALALVGGVAEKDESEFQDLRRLALHPKVVAIGECGLDYFHMEEKDFPTQVEAFEKHIAIANEAKKPLMLHVRNGKGKKIEVENRSKEGAHSNAYRDALEILKKSARVPFNFHFFAGTIEDMHNIFAQGGTVSFTGVITFTHDYDELIKNGPLEKIMSETDCPYVSPIPHRGKRNEPTFVIEVVKQTARIRGEEEDKVRSILLENARNFFRIM